MENPIRTSYKQATFYWCYNLINKSFYYWRNIYFFLNVAGSALFFIIYLAIFLTLANFKNSKVLPSSTLSPILPRIYISTKSTSKKKTHLLSRVEIVVWRIVNHSSPRSKSHWFEGNIEEWVVEWSFFFSNGFICLQTGSPVVETSGLISFCWRLIKFGKGVFQIYSFPGRYLSRRGEPKWVDGEFTCL